jgi:hypothetical protein
MAILDDGRWHPGIGDPTVIGWVTVVAYGAAALVCYLCQRDAQRGPHHRFWLGMTLIMLALGVNKQLDLQTWFTEVGRDLAIEQGWWENRRTVQFYLIAALIVAALVSSGWIRSFTKALDNCARLAATGLLLLFVFVVIRAASFHHIDEFLGMKLQELSFNALLELSGIGMVLFFAFAKARSLRQTTFDWQREGFKPPR